MNISELLEAYNANGMLGTLTGITLTERDRLFRQLHREFSEALEQARITAGEIGRSVTLDGSALCGVNEGEQWIAHPDGSATRTLSLFEDIVELTESWVGLHDKKEKPQPAVTGAEPHVSEEESIERIRALWLRCAYNGLWSPSGTNWQPIRSVELTGDEIAELLDGTDISIPPKRAGLALLARTDYESMLGDVAKIARFSLISRAEFIDMGIYASVCELTAKAQGCPTVVQFIPKRAQAHVTKKLIALLTSRCHRYADTALRERTEHLIRMLQTNDYAVDGLFTPPLTPSKLTPSARELWNGLPRSSFDRLVGARCSQRVASPVRDMRLEEFDELWQLAFRSVDPSIRSHIRYASFHWNESAPKLFGQAMFDGLYGAGADLDTGEGGQGGIISLLTIPSLLTYFQEETQLTPSIRELLSLDGAAREAKVAETAIPLSLVPRTLREFLLTKPQFHEENDCLVGRNGQPLTIDQFVRMMRLLALSFGRFFLSFQNTHPITAVILARKTDDVELLANIYRNIGRIVATLTFVCRAKGLVSIIKGGPTEINRVGIGQVVREQTRDPEVKKLLEEESFLASLTFQIGYPLGPDDHVTARGETHTGLQERSNDKRSPRAPLANHYFPLAPASFNANFNP